jgi:hypothetical protein
VVSLDHLPRLRIGRLSAYSTLGLIGIAVGYAAVLGVTRARGDSPMTAALVVVVSVATLIVAGLVGRALSGREEYVLYRNVLQVLMVVSLAAFASGRPVLRVLDATMVGLAAFLVFGRMGCLLSGCCHGRPARRGIRYPAGHTAAGFPTYLVGRPLFPIQLVEGGLTALLLVAGLALALSGEPAGSALAFVLGIYGPLRFGLEFLRGDRERPFVLGLSEAQWTAVALAWGVVGLALAAGLRLAGGYLVLAVALTAVAAAVTATALRRPASAWLLAQPSHLDELLALAGSLERTAAGELVAGETSRGLRLSLSIEPIAGGIRRHYALSHGHRPLGPRASEALRAALLWRHTTGARWQSRAGGSEGVIHLVVDEGFRPAG